jgi:ABC-2 type transport system ATP-binding protein
MTPLEAPRTPGEAAATPAVPASPAAPPGAAVVVARGLTKVFKDFWGRDKARAVDGVDFSIRPGEVFGLLGPNGSGKSTTLKMLLGLLRPTRGHIEVFGRGPNDVRTKERIGYLPEDSCLYRYFTPVEALEFFGRLFDLPAGERRQRIEQLLGMVGLTGARSRTVGEFSKGMQRRLGLAQALINDPDLVILDEPTAGLDPIGCREVKDLVLALARRGKTVLLSSHLLADVEDVCDRVVIYYGGRIQAHGPLRELLATPDSVQLTLPALPREALQRLLEFIRLDLRENRVAVGVPSRNLESYFLAVVERARAAAATTSGATASAAVAPYLQGPQPAFRERDADRILERFVDVPATAGPPAEPAPAPAPAPAAHGSPGVPGAPGTSGAGGGGRGVPGGGAASGGGAGQRHPGVVGGTGGPPVNLAARRILAVAGQTVTAALRLRVMVAGGVMLFVAVLALPFLVKHNGTARMLAQVMLAYNLVAITGLLGFTTLWLACGALAGEIASGHLQLVATKPVARWQVWLGKWIGIVAVDAVLLATSLAVVGGLLHLRARELPPGQQQEFRQSVLVARAAVREAPADLRADVAALVRRRLAQPGAQGLDPALVQEQMQAFARARHETVAPNYRRLWTLDLGRPPPTDGGLPLQLRVKFQAANIARTVTYPTVWIVGDPASGRYLRLEKHLTAATVHEFSLPAGLVSPGGRLAVECENRSDATLLFRLEDGLELLHPVGGFGANLARAGGIVLCWLALLAAIGLAASSLLSFPTAVLASLCLLYVGSSGATLDDIVREGTVFAVDHEQPVEESGLVDRVAVPAFRLLRTVVDALVAFSPSGDLGAGRAIGWDQLASAFLRVVVGAGGLFALAGMLAFHRRQLGLPVSGP